MSERGAKLYFFGVFIVGIFLNLVLPAAAEHRSFKHFSLYMPEGWDGDEQTGFVGDDPNTYLLTLGKKDEEEDAFIAQVSVFLLPNKPGVDAETAARRMAEDQADAGEPVKEGNFWVFSGEPRSRAMKGMAKTLVNASPEWLLIIIAQDPFDEGAGKVIASLRGETDEAIKMLGR